MRLFLAIVPPPSVQRAAFAVTGALRHPGDGVAWVKEANLHFTLRFLGEVGDSARRDVVHAAQEGAGAHAPFEVVLGPAGAFPAPKQARVLWLGVAAGAEAMTALAASLADALAARGFAKEERPFSAHLTIGRVREPRADWSARLAGAAPDPEAAAFQVERIALVRSQLARGGSIYTVVEDAPLGGR